METTGMRPASMMSMRLLASTFTISPTSRNVGELPIDLHQPFFRLKQAGVLPGGAHRVRAMLLTEPHQIAANLAE